MSRADRVWSQSISEFGRTQEPNMITRVWSESLERWCIEVAMTVGRGLGRKPEIWILIC